MILTQAQVLMDKWATSQWPAAQMEEEFIVSNMQGLEWEI